MSIEQKLVTINDHHAEYSNFFAYGHQTKGMLADGWYIKHIHDDQSRRTAWVLYERLSQGDTDTEKEG